MEGEEGGSRARGEREGESARGARASSTSQRERGQGGGEAALTPPPPPPPAKPSLDTQSMGSNYFLTICVVISVLAVMSKLIGAI